MENFDSGPKNVREKSVYLLHLDVPRIIIVGALLVGLVIISFLVGMNVFKDDNGSGRNISGISMTGDKSRDLGLNDKSGLHIPDGKDLLEKTENSDSKNIVDGDGRNGDRENKARKESSDVFTSDNLKEIVPPVKNNTIDVKKKTGTEDSLNTGDKGIVKSKKGNSKKSDIRSDDRDTTAGKKVKKKSKVVEAADDTSENTAKTGTFAVQVASFDKKSRAAEEVRALKDMKYDAFLSAVHMDGKKFYRVKIGPIASKKLAIKMLNDIQEISKYRDSFLAKE